MLEQRCVYFRNLAVRKMCVVGDEGGVDDIKRSSINAIQVFHRLAGWLSGCVWLKCMSVYIGG